MHVHTIRKDRVSEVGPWFRTTSGLHLSINKRRSKVGASESLDRGRLCTDGGRPSPPNIARGCEKRREGVLPVRAQSVGQRRRRWVWVWAWLVIVCDGRMNSVDGRCGVRTSRSRRTCLYSSTAICLTLAIKHTHTKSAMIGTFFFSFTFFPPARTPDGLRTVAPPREDSCHTVSKMSDVSDTACLDGRKSLQIKGNHDQPTDLVSQCHVCESRRG